MGKKSAIKKKVNSKTSIEDDKENMIVEGMENINLNRKVQFGGNEVRKFDRQDAPGINFYELENARTEEGRVQYVQGKEEEEIEATADRHIYSLFTADITTREEYDTKTMTKEELIYALEAKDLSTNGTREELRIRLEKQLIREGQAASPSEKKKYKYQPESWLSNADPARYLEEAPVVSSSLFQEFKPSATTSVKTYSRKRK